MVAPRSAIFAEAGDSFLYRLNTSDGPAILSVDAEGDGFALTELFWAVGRLPSPTDFDGRQSEGSSDDVSTFAGQFGAPVYVLVRASGLTKPNVGLSITAEAAVFGVRAIATGSIGDTGYATLEVVGAELGEHVVFELLAADKVTAYAAEKVYSTESNIAYPTFHMDPVPQGVYTLRITDGEKEVDSGIAIEVVETIAPALEVRLIGEAFVRAGRQGGVTLTYRNGGNVDLMAPLIKLSSAVRVEPPGRALGLDTAVEPGGYVDHFLAISGDGPAGVLRPNSRLEEQAYSFVTPTNASNVDIDLDWLTPAGFGDAFNWSAYEDALRPPDLPDEGGDSSMGCCRRRWALRWVR